MTNGLAVVWIVWGSAEREVIHKSWGKYISKSRVQQWGKGGEERESNKIDGKNDYKGIQLVVTWHENTFPRVNGKPR